ncbi:MULTISPECIES: periplasmic heavy metal sensor [Sphingosinicellaceae]|uniref:periplasmic heavy metal sensor n=1 Tax=Sphingosinicellaceae TaxID=2820280 RepID=UPI001C1E10B0|nr:MULTISPECIES: periplasmic heavy metal sensor [Polymorphobacter]QYE34681.1 periplasmic heavy metal sensor [Polymorphobacter sp. PAMC 29334]UAJ09888.1 periplasmic heavy metal sensor [Polymorphobacter megasporae]
MKRVLAALLLLGATAPAMAQMPPPPGDSMPDGPGPGGRSMRGPHGMQQMFASMSPAGRATMMAAFKSADPRMSHEASNAARDRMLAVLDADRLDPVALKRAMDEEREASSAAKLKQQGAMLVAFQQLSVTDRRAFVADARAMRARMDARMAEMRKRGGGPDGMMPPPPME